MTSRTFFSMKNTLRIILIACLLTGFFSAIHAQPLSYDYLKEESARQKEAAIKLAKEKGWPIKGVLPNGREYSLIKLNEEGKPQYFSTSNLNAARTISTNRVWSGGNLGLNLNGQGMPAGSLGEWDGGAVRTTHQEFGTRVSQMDGATTLSEHATHVAGTMVAGGVGSINYKGMAHQATLQAYDWDNDVGEMSTAGVSGMLVSNHSYGLLTGFQWGDWSGTQGWHWWGDPSISATTDYRYGFYDNEARDWDIVARSFPNYLLVKAAGNDRGDGPAPGSQHFVFSGGSWISSTAVRNVNGGSTGYDCMSGSAISKNVLTVGAVNDIVNGYTTASGVVMSSFSGWGPTDDGRIKPDVVGNGVSLTSSSSTSNTSYATMSGTSMASPNVSGSLLLLQQRYRELNGSQPMRAATLRGLVIHTADEAGPATGPDYMFGWGLMNTAKAAVLIGQNGTTQHIIQGTLVPGQPFNLAITPTLAPLRITLCWTDLPGTVSAASLNSPTSKLVNDLDLRISNSPMGVRFPYVLNPFSPTAAATTGDNTRDNVEQIYVASPTAGTYTLTVSNKAGMTANQPFSIIISGANLALTPPVVDFSASNTGVCPGGSVTFTPIVNGNVNTYNWSFPGGSPSFSSQTSPTVTYNTPGQYQVQLIVFGPTGSDTMIKTQFIQVGGSSLPFNESFTDGMGKWTVLNPDPGSISWALDSIATFTGTSNKSAWMNFYSYQASGHRDELISPPLNLTNVSNGVLSFKHAYTRYGTQPSDTLMVQVSTGCSSNWQTVAVLAENGSGNFATTGTGFTLNSSFVPLSASSWCGSGNGASCNSISLNNYAGQNGVRVRFLSVNNYGNNLYLDDISVTSANSVLAPVARFGALTPRTICAGGSVTFRDSSLNNPSSRSWTFPGGSPATFAGISPTVTYANPGTYEVKLRVSNVSGTDSLVRTGYITVVGGQALPLIEGFETMINGTIGSPWTVTNIDNATTWGTAPTAGLTTGSRSAWINFFNYQNAIGQRDGLETPLLDFRNRTNLNLSFKHAYTRYNSSATDSLIVLVSTGCSSNWTRLAAFGENGTGVFATTTSPYTNNVAFSPASAADWCGTTPGANCVNIPLNTYAGQGAVRIRLEAVNNYGNNLFIDDIDVTGTSTLQPPSVAFGAITSRTICAPNSVSFRDSSLQNPTSWSWSFPGGTPATSSLQHPTVTYNTPGVYAVTLTASNASGSNSLTRSAFITVNPALQVSWNGPSPLICVNAGPVTLIPGTPQNGLFSGPGVVGTVFNPLSAGVGTHQLVYTVVQNGCVGRDTVSVTVTSSPSASIAPISSVCANDTGFQLTGGNPAGGIFSGTGVVNNRFIPSLAGPGTHTITYVVGTPGCQGQASVNITVRAVPSVTLDPINPVCDNANPVTLNGTPAGGVYAGAGVSGNNFNPSVAGVGSHWLKYFVTQNGCTAADSLPVQVLASPMVSLLPLSPVCINAPSFTLTGATPAGGIFSGSGVSNGTFNPAISGVGSIPVFYTYAAPNGCISVATQNQVVNALPNIIFPALLPACSRDTFYSLNMVLPSGGVFTGTGVVGNNFNPQMAGPGIHSITYFIALNGCLNSSSQPIVVNPRPATPTLTSQGANAIRSSSPIGNRWFLGNTLLSDTTQVMVPTSNGLYRAMVVLDDCPSDTSQAFAFTTVNASSLEFNRFTAYPNPATNQLWMEGIPEGKVMINLADVRGTRVLSMRVSGGDKQMLELDAIPSGVYLLHLVHDTAGTKTVKLVISK